VSCAGETAFAAESPDAGDKLLAATFFLMGLRYPRELTKQLLQGVQHMEESTTYQYILEQGGLRAARKILTHLGEKHLGPANVMVQTRIDSIMEIERLEQLLDRIHEATSWDDLLARD